MPFFLKSRSIKITIFLITLFLTVKARMGRHESEPHVLTLEQRRRVIPHTLRQVLVLHEVDIPIYSIKTAISMKRVRNGLQRILRRIEVIRVQSTLSIVSRTVEPLLKVAVMIEIFISFMEFYLRISIFHRIFALENP